MELEKAHKTMLKTKDKKNESIKMSTGVFTFFFCVCTIIIKQKYIPQKTEVSWSDNK